MPADKRALLDHFLALYENEALPALPQLRHSFCYNDANDTNILVRADDPLAPRVAGFIDLGDMTRCPAIAELAVALAYAMMGSPRPLQHVAPLIAAYHRAFPLTEDEIRLLYPLVAARLCLSVCISWHQQRREPANRHLSVSESGAWQLLLRAAGDSSAPRPLCSFGRLVACPRCLNPPPCAIICRIRTSRR